MPRIEVTGADAMTLAAFGGASQGRAELATPGSHVFDVSPSGALRTLQCATLSTKPAVTPPPADRGALA